MHVTQIRFHADTWRAIKAEAERLRISAAELVRTAVLLYLGQRQAEDRIAGLEARHDALAARVERLARLLTRLAERVVGRAR